MSTHLPIEMPELSLNILVNSETVGNTQAILAVDLSGKHTDKEVLIPVVTRQARIPAPIHGQIRRIHHHTDAVELDVTSLNEDDTEWDTFTIDRHDPIYFLGG
ncbi:hypothetical protein SEA_GIBBLES_91 [Gordonia phage Gibbles]|nr:hypothetical protein SEA_GIBBLES_91 [Gordonia phage Gibbles]